MNLVEIECPVSGQRAAFPAHMARPLQALSREFEIAIEDLWVMVKITAEKGREWLPDSLEYWDLLVAITNDEQILKLARKGEVTLSIDELLQIRARARRGLELDLEHERDPKKRAMLEAMLRETPVWRATRAMAKAMLERQGRSK